MQTRLVVKDKAQCFGEADLGYAKSSLELHQVPEAPVLDPYVDVLRIPPSEGPDRSCSTDAYMFLPIFNRLDTKQRWLRY